MHRCAGKAGTSAASCWVMVQFAEPDAMRQLTAMPEAEKHQPKKGRRKEGVAGVGL